MFCMATISEQLQSYRSELVQAQARGDQAIARKIMEAVTVDDVFNAIIGALDEPPSRLG